MKTKLFSLLCTLMCAGNVFASTIIDGIYYNLNSIDLTAEVTNETGGSWASSYSGSVTIPETVTYSNTTYRVSTIGDYAFYKCSSLTSVAIPNSVTTIGEYAFDYCIGLTSVTIGNSVTTIGSFAFCGCSGLTSITIPNSVTTIGSETFSGCRGLTSVTIGNSVTTIGSWAFSGCSGLTSVTIPNSVTTIGRGAFSSCSGLTLVTIPNSVTTIGTQAFERCSGLTSVIIPDSITTIGSSAFRDCSGLTSVTIPNSVTTIGEKAFYDCYKLTSVTIGNSVTTIGEDAFRDCSGLTKTNYTGTIADWCKIKFGNHSANPMDYSHNFFINDVEIIKDLVLPEGVNTIGDYAFSGCRGLTSVTIPNSVTTIGSETFSGCSSIADIYTYAITPPSAGTYTFFSGVSHHCYIHVPAGTIRAYQMAPGWDEFYHFFEISEVPSGEGKVDVQVTENSAVFSWPVNPTASSYTLIIKKDDVVFCTLTFNSLGQLVGMAFAPTRNMTNATSAETTTYGYSFVVSNLDTNSTYDFVFTAKDASDEVLSEEVGHFTTTPTALPSTLMSTSVSGKILYNNHLYILRDGNLHTATGARVK